MAFLSGLRVTRTGIVFIVGVMVLIAVVIGAIFIVRDRGEQVRRQEEVRVAQQNLEDQSKTIPEETKPAATSSPRSSSEGEENPPVQNDTASSASSDALPETGADLGTLLVVTLLALSASYYVVSRQAVRGL
jgi:uncharacterized protein HemX